MKNNRIIWGMAALVFLITIAVSLGTINSHSQQDTSEQQDKSGSEEWSKYPLVDYDAPEPSDVAELEERKLKNKRYDNQGLVKKNPHPDTGGVQVIDELPLPPVIPTAESDLIIVGKILNGRAYLSNDKRGIYSEYTVQIKEILKAGDADKTASGKEIIVDRTGGRVRYANGQQVSYQNAVQNLPKIGGEYVLFLKNDKQSPNYKILTGYQIEDDKVYSLDDRGRFNEFKEKDAPNFVKAVRNKIKK
ncbi:MAG TPA: hypothetical protein VF599_16435 [Pyrinomonadaceae bacterium]